MVKNILFSLFLLSVSLFSYSQNKKDISKYIEKARVEWDVPGLSVAVVKDGEVFLARGFGELEVNSDKPVNENSLFAIASNTKAFVSSSLAVLEQEGKISWSDKVVDYLPYFKLYDPYATSEANIEDLLCHRLGLGTYSGDVIWYKSNLPAEQVIKRIQYVPQAYTFRGGYGYSNLMFITAGEVIRNVTGKPWHEYVKTTFTQPLGMSRTIFTVSDLEEIGNFATPHKPMEGLNKPIEWTRWDNMGAAGGIISSASDMARWMIFQLNRGENKGKAILQKDSQNKLWTPHNNYFLSEKSKQGTPGRHFNGYGLGWGLSDYFGNLMVSHGGGYDGMYSRVVMLPDQQLGVVVLTNTMNGIASPLCYYIINQFIQEDKRDWSGEALKRSKENKHRENQLEMRYEKRIMNTDPTLTDEEVEGTYYDPMYGEVRIDNINNQYTLKFEYSPNLNAELRHWHHDTWEIVWKEEHAWFDFGTVRFTKDNNRDVVGLEFDVPNYDIFFDELHPVKID